MPNYTTSYQHKPHMRRKPGGTGVGRRLPSRRSHMANLRPVRADMPDLRHSQGFGRRAPRRPKNSRLPYVLIAIGVAVVLFAASIVLYLNRSVQITLNGSAHQFHHRPGDFVAGTRTLSGRPAGG